MTVHDIATASARTAETSAPKVRERERSAIAYRGRTVCELSIALMAAECIERLGEAGILVEQTSDFELALDMVGHMDKYLTDFMSPRKNEFSRGTAYGCYSATMTARARAWSARAWTTPGASR